MLCVNKTSRNFDKMIEDFLSTVKHLVEFETPSINKSQLDTFSLIISDYFEQLNCNCKVYSQQDYGNHVLACFKASSKKVLKPNLVLAHMDTVYPLGTLNTFPFRLLGNKAYGPGIYDMKAGIVQLLYALRTLKNKDCQLKRPVQVLLTSDEEVGSPSSRKIIESLAAKAANVLVLEPPGPGGALKTTRKGVGFYKISFRGVEAHSGDLSKGASAIVELAKQVCYLTSLSDTDNTINVGKITGGLSANTVAKKASMDLDLRCVSIDAFNHFDSLICNLKTFDQRIKVSVLGGLNRPPMEENAGNRRLFLKAKEISNELDINLQEYNAGGGSDGNFTSAMGIPTLDGLGAVGDSAHSSDEHILINHLIPRTLLLARILETF